MKLRQEECHDYKDAYLDDYLLINLRKELLRCVCSCTKSETSKCNFFTETTRPDIFRWIMSSATVLEMLLFNGQTICMPTCIKILEILLDEIQIHNKSPPEPDWMLKLVIATALSFSGGINMAQPLVYVSEIDKPPPHETEIEIHFLSRFRNFVAWSEASLLCPEFYTLTVWHLRMVVSARVSDEELCFARSKSWIKDAMKLGRFRRNLITYKQFKLDTEFINSEKFYDTKWVTLQHIWDQGGACGAVSHFWVAMIQAHGLPACILFEPGHMSYAWFDGIEWRLENSVHGSKATRIPQPGLILKKGGMQILIRNCFMMGKDGELGQERNMDLVLARSYYPVWKEEEWKNLPERVIQLFDKVLSSQKDLNYVFNEIAGFSYLRRELQDIDSVELASYFNFEISKEVLDTFPKEQLDFKPTLKKSAIDIQFPICCVVENIDIKWKKEKYVPDTTDVMYKRRGDDITADSKTNSCVVDGVSVSFRSKSKTKINSFNFKQIKQLCITGNFLYKHNLLEVLVLERFKSNINTKNLLMRIIDRFS